MSEAEAGKTVSVHYVGTFDDGTEFDNSRTRDEPLTFQLGDGRMISGFDAAVGEMVVGESRTISLTPEDAYGEAKPELVRNVPRTTFHPEFEFKIGAMVQGKVPNGQLSRPFIATIVSANNDSVALDFNHPMAGKHLNFEIELLTVD